MMGAQPEGTVLRERDAVRLVLRENAVERALGAIRAGRLDIWFEADRSVARRVAALCPDVRVYSPHGHLRLVEDDAG
jgi:hypothetical protein